MNKILHILKYNKRTLVMLALAVLYILIPTTEAAAQAWMQAGPIPAGSKAQAGNPIAIGEIIWIAITLVFSFLLNLYLRRMEKAPQKSDFAEPEQPEQTMVAIPVKIKTETIRKAPAKRTKKLIHRFAYQREQISKPVTAIQYLTVSHKKTGVAS